jgi:predicted transcriptional regulator
MDTRITDAELDVMEALWGADEPLTAAEIAERVDQSRDWTLATVKTMLSRLAAKGAISYRVEGRRFLYSPAIERQSYVGSESRRFVDKLFGGRLSPLVARLAEEDSLDDEDIAAIEAILKELRDQTLP